MDAPAAGGAGTTRYEQLLRGGAPGPQHLAAAMAEASRRARASLAQDAPHLPVPLVEVATGVAGPLLAGYLLWCFEEARLAGCRRLYFVARDGEVLLSMARRLAQEHDAGLDLRYLMGSRRAWLVAGMTTVDVERLAAVAGRSEVNTVRTLLDWVDLAPEDAAEELAAAGYPAAAWDAAVPPGGIGDVLAVLLEPSLARRVQRRADEASSAAGRYLGDAGLLDGEPYAIVEMEGRGNVGRLLEPVVRAAGGRPPALECYFALVAPAPSPGRRLRGYLYDEGRGTGQAERADDIYVALEVFTAGTHGGVRGYRLGERGAEAVLAREHNGPALAWGLRDLRAVLDVFAAELARSLPPAGVRDDVRGPSWAALRAFWLAPTRGEVEVWGSFPFEDGAGHYAIAAGFTNSQVLRSALSGRLRMRRRGTWPAGVLANAPVHLRLAQRVLRRVRRS